MNKSFLNNVFIFLIVLTFFNCENDDDKNTCEEPASTEIAYVTNVMAPTTGVVNESITIDLDFIVINGCGGFSMFNVDFDPNTNTSIIEVEAEYVGCFCTAALETITTQYQFKVTNPGVYTLKFRSSETEFIEVDIEVN